MWVDDNELEKGEVYLMKIFAEFEYSKSSALNFIEGGLVPGKQFNGDRGIVIVGCGEVGKTLISELNTPTQKYIEDILFVISKSDDFSVTMEKLRVHLEKIKLPTINDASDKLKESLDILYIPIQDFKQSYDSERLIDDSTKFRDNPINPHFKKRFNYKRKLKKNKR
tara:strand:+ start:48411 stop:48911 length:501 start_codon:yes stop_codon:yes gene_type:complete